MPQEVQAVSQIVDCGSGLIKISYRPQLSFHKYQLAYNFLNFAIKTKFIDTVLGTAQSKRSKYNTIQILCQR